MSSIAIMRAYACSEDRDDGRSENVSCEPCSASPSQFCTPRLTAFHLKQMDDTYWSNNNVSVHTVPVST